MSNNQVVSVDGATMGDLGLGNENSTSNVERATTTLSSANFDQHYFHEDRVIKDSEYFQNLIMRDMNNHLHKYCFLRCLVGNDLYEFRDEMVSRLISEPHRIEEIIAAGSIPAMAWWGILKVLQEKNKLTNSYRWCCRATKLGYPDKFVSRDRSTATEHVVIIDKLNGKKQTEYFILHTPGYLERVGSSTIIPVEASVDLMAFLPEQDQVAL